ncbi:peptidoglycan-binding protein LysM [Leuconostoc citreum]
MSDFDPNNMSRMARSKKQKVEPEFARQSDRSSHKHKGFKIFLIVLGFAILSSVPIYGALNHQKTPQQTAIATSKKSTSQSQKASSETSAQSSSEQASSSETVASSTEAPAAASSEVADSSGPTAPSTPTTNSAVLGASQTLYNFAVTHGMTTDQVIALNPGLSVNNYTQYAGRTLNVK